MKLNNPRGVFPLKAKVNPAAIERFRNIPGVKPFGRGGIRATQDASVALREVGLIRRAYSERVSWPAPIAFQGYADATASGMLAKARSYQIEDACRMAANGWIINANPMRSGKTFEALLAATLADPQGFKVVVCPAFARGVWAREIRKWTGQDPVLVYGRGGAQARIWNPKIKGKRYVREQSDIAQLIRDQMWVVVNYELLIPHSQTSSRGVKSIRADLPGWTPFLKSLHPEIVIFDECHYLRGWNPGSAQKKKDRRSKAYELARDAKHVWGLSGTPIFSRVKDLWGQCDVLSGGTWGATKPFGFHVRYCEGEKREIPSDEVDGTFWYYDGESNLEELSERTKYFMIKHAREKILPHLPSKTRTVELLSDITVEHKYGDVREHAAEQMRETFKRKVDDLVKHSVNTACQGEKVIIFVKLRDNLDELINAMKKAITSREFKAACSRAKLETWSFSGGNPDANVEKAEKFVDHPGAAIAMATIDSLQGAISLKGASEVNFADLHYDPSAMFQAEERSFEAGISKLIIRYWIVPGTYDERAAQIVLPKVRQISRALQDANAQSTLAVLQKEKPQETLEEMALRQFGDVDLSMFEGVDYETDDFGD